MGTPGQGSYRLASALPEADFNRMVDLAVVPGTRDAVVVTQGGKMWRLPLDGGPARPFADLTGRVVNATGNEEGLLGVAFSPRFQQDRRVYVYYTRGSPEPSVLSRFRVAGGALDESSEQVLLEVRQRFQNHNGGGLLFGPDGMLYLSLGDGGSGGDPEGNGQNLGTLLGSILRLDVSGSGYAVPPDNPFAGTGGARGEIYAHGLRNPWRFSFDRATGDLWAGDVGQQRWEEVDRIVAGGNYGWNITEGFECFQTPGCDTAGLRLPRAAYSHDLGCSVTGGYVYRGPSMPELVGWYVYADFCSGRVWAVDTGSDADPALLTEADASISSFAEMPNGELLVLTFQNRVFRLARR